MAPAGCGASCSEDVDQIDLIKNNLPSGIRQSIFVAKWQRNEFTTGHLSSDRGSHAAGDPVARGDPVHDRRRDRGELRFRSADHLQALVGADGMPASGTGKAGKGGPLPIESGEDAGVG